MMIEQLIESQEPLVEVRDLTISFGHQDSTEEYQSQDSGRTNRGAGG